MIFQTVERKLEIFTFIGHNISHDGRRGKRLGKPQYFSIPFRTRGGKYSVLFRQVVKTGGKRDGREGWTYNRSGGGGGGGRI